MLFIKKVNFMETNRLKIRQIKVRMWNLLYIDEKYSIIFVEFL